MKFTRKLLCVSYLEPSTNEYVRSKVESLMGPRESFRAIIVKRWKMIWFGHVTRYYSLCKQRSREGTIDCVRIGEGDNVRAGRKHHRMDTHGNDRQLGECCLDILAWRTSSESSV